MLISSGYVMCYSAKWLDSPIYYYNSIDDTSPKRMLKGIWNLLNEADAVVTYNGERFDIPTLNKDFLEHGMPPPSPFRQIDLYKTVKSRFRFPSNKLEYVCRALGVGQKIKTIGYSLWKGCMAGDKDCWKMMQEYNINDVKILEEVYYKVLPWIKNHANFGLYQEDKMVCPNCGSNNHQKRGFAYTLTNKYQRMVCNDCHNWFRATKAEGIPPGKKFVNIQ